MADRSTLPLPETAFAPMTSTERTNPDSNRRPSTFETAEILGIPIAYTDGRALVRTVRADLKEGKKGWICGINAHAINLSYDLGWLRNFYRNSLLNCSEGVGVSLAARVLGIRLPHRIVWAYWILDLMAAMEEDGSSVFLLGATAEVAASAAHRLKERFPNLRIVGQHHGYFEKSENRVVVNAINEAKVDVLLVAMGMPKQEEWIAQNFEGLNVKVIFPVGALFDYVSGMKKRCPRWMVVLGLEWLYRLLKEPGRLWKRYLIGNLLFIARVLRRRSRMNTKTIASSDNS